MPYDRVSNHSIAEYQSWVQLPLSAQYINEGPSSQELSAQQFAQLVYNVNPSTLNISATQINVDAVGINDTGDVRVVDGNLMVNLPTLSSYLISIDTKLNNLNGEYSQWYFVSGDISWDMKAVPGTSTADPLWQIKKIEVDLSGTTRVTWASGSVAYNNIADDFETHPYS